MDNARRDLKLAADREAEGIIFRQLAAASNHAIVSEESGVIGTIGARNEQLIWVIDPLDGTVNYSQRIPLACVSIALCAGRVPLLGVVYDFNRDELFHGIDGAGAFCNGRPIRTSSVARMQEAVLATGFPSRFDFSTGGLSSFVRALQIYRKVRLLGSAAMSLAYVASGRIDAYAERKIMFWDVAAGCALVSAAGGKHCIDWQANSFTSPVCVTAHNGRLGRS